MRIKPNLGINMPVMYKLGKDDLAEVISDADGLVPTGQHSREAISQGSLGVGHVTTCENIKPVYWIELTILD